MKVWRNNNESRKYKHRHIIAKYMLHPSLSLLHPQYLHIIPDVTHCVYRNQNFLPPFSWARYSLGLHHLYPLLLILHFMPVALVDGNPHGISGKLHVFLLPCLILSAIREYRISEMAPLASDHLTITHSVFLKIL
jgi:hypothetical protein